MTVVAKRVAPLIEAGDLSAPPGSRPWSLAVRLEIQALLHEKESNADRLLRNLEGFRQHEGFRQLEDATGEAFGTYEAFCVARPPFGLGIDPTLLDAVVAERRSGQVRAQQVLPLEDYGGDRVSDQVMNHNLVGRRKLTDYWIARLARDHPDYLERLRRGEYRTPHAAAVAAGVARHRLAVEPTVDGLARVAAAHLSVEERAALIVRLRSQLDDVE